MELRISEVMERNGVSIVGLVDTINKLGFGKAPTRGTIANIISGKNSPKVDTLDLIAKGLGVDIRELFKASEGINGFVEYAGEVHRIRSEEDLQRLLDLIKEG